MRNWKTKVKVQLGNSAARSLDHLQSFSFLISKMGAIMPADCCCFQDAVGQWTCKHLRVYKFQCTWEKLSPSSGPGISSCFNKIANSFYVCWGQVPISQLITLMQLSCGSKSGHGLTGSSVQNLTGCSQVLAGLHSHLEAWLRRNPPPCLFWWLEGFVSL